MKYTPFEKAPKRYNPNAVTSEYGGNGNIDGAYVEINGTYPPEAGTWAVNTQSDMSIFAHSGEGKIEVRYTEEETGRQVTRETKVALGKRAHVLIERSEEYRFEGDGLGVFIASTPPWNPEQARTVN